MSKRLIRNAAIFFLLLGMFAAAVYFYITSGGMIARQKPSAWESSIARLLVNLSVPQREKMRSNPLGTDAVSAQVMAGRELYRQKCEVCHASDGGGVTETGSGQYPPPLDLRGPEVRKATDGELFYLIRNGIRNTAMPGWQMPDEQVWQLVAYVRNLPKVAALPAEGSQENGPVSNTSASYTGSAECRSCHTGIYDRWKKTRMANVVRDPREYPDAITPDLTKSKPPFPFTRDDVALVYGSKWKQRYFKKIGDDYFPLPVQWDVTHQMWRPYKAAKGTDWWTAYFPDDNFQRPTGLLCDGCHSVNYNIQTKTVAEWNVGCESCHGPGGDHVKRAISSNIVNPGRGEYVAANDVCIQCHSQGQPRVKPLNGKYYDWPVGFRAGLKLNDFWTLEEHKLGEQSFTHYADGTAHKNRMQGNDYVTSRMYTHGVTCFTCHDAHGTEHNAILRKPTNELCLDCHAPNSANGPRAATITEHTHHKAGSPGSECIACHMPKIEQTIADVNVRSHTFRFVPPSQTESLKVPNACNVCHMDKSTKWAGDALKSWSSMSPWRVAN